MIKKKIDWKNVDWTGNARIWGVILIITIAVLGFGLIKKNSIDIGKRLDKVGVPFCVSKGQNYRSSDSTSTITCKKNGELTSYVVDLDEIEKIYG